MKSNFVRSVRGGEAARRPDPGRAGSRLAWSLLLLLSLCLSAGTLAAEVDGGGAGAGGPPLVLSLQRAAQPNQWSVSWPTQPGQRYVLQKSVDLVVWLEAGTTNATGFGVSKIDEGLAGQGRTFWRVVHLGGPLQPISVSPVVASYQLASGASKALLRIVTGGFQIVDHVVFLDQGVLLGNAVQGLNGSWSFNLVWDGRSPRPQRVTARVSTEDGLVVDTPVQAFLLADPAKFVPLTTNGTSAHGEFVSLDASGRLSPFLYYPEGTGDGVLRTGSHFEFSSGASIVSVNGGSQLEFVGGRFHRGHRDPAPMSSGPGTHRLTIDEVTPAAVAGALGLPGGAAIDLVWGDLPVRWIDGALGEAGWAGLRVRPPLGDFLLPSGHDCAAVTFHPRTGEPSLVLCFHGDWSPFPEATGPRFRIPRAEPLKVRISLSGRVDVHGTVETFLPDGATVRGSVSWVEPNFEARFEGRNIVIPAFTSLKRALPANPALCLPAGTTTTSAEMDAATKCLTSFRDVYRALAMGGLGEAPTLGGSAATAPLAEPEDPVGTALHAWAARLASWNGDRAGQVLDEPMRNDLAKLVGNAAKTGESANELSTVLKLLRDVLTLRKHRSAGVGGAATALDTGLAEAEARLLAAADRVVAGSGTLEPSSALEEILSLLAQASGEVSGSGGAGGFQPASGAGAGPRLQAIKRGVKDKVGPEVFSLRAIAVGDFDGSDNPALLGLDSGGLLKFMEELVIYFESLRENGRPPSADQAPVGIPLWEAVKQTRVNFERVHNLQCADALATRDYLKLRAVVADRARYFYLNFRLGVLLPSNYDKFDRNTFGLLDSFADAFSAMPSRTRERYCGADFLAADLIASTTADRGAASASLDRARALVASCSDLLVGSSGADRRCDEVLRALLAAGLDAAPRESAQEGAAFPDVSGRYEAATVADRTESYTTLQLNQGGRYVKGRIQEQQVRENGTSGRYRDRAVEGWFLRQTSVPGTMELAVRVVDSATGATEILPGTARREAGGLTVLTLDGQTFVQVTTRPSFGPSVINAFEKQQRDAVRSFSEAPLHHQMLSRVGSRAGAARLIVERFYGDASGATQEEAEARKLNDLLGEIRLMVDPAQRPVARMILRQVLSGRTFSVLKSKVTRIELVGGRIERSYWELALGMALEYPNLVTHAPEMLGFAASALVNSTNNLRSVDLYRYSITIQQKSFPVKAIFGASELDVTIRKIPPAGSGEPEATFNYDGFLITVGPVSAGVGVTISDSTKEVFSPFSYGPADFEGEVRFIQGGAGFAFFDQALAGSVGLFEIVGSGRFPTLVLNMTEVSGQFGLALQASLFDLGAGMIVAEGNNREPGRAVFGDQVRFDVSTEGRFDQAVYFEVNSDVISPCGLQFLREFVAEYRSLFEAPKSFVEVRGFTDRTGDDNANLDLSQRRANRVRDALVGFVGPDLQISPENITAIGFGEVPAANAGVPDSPNPAADNPIWRKVEVVVGGRIMATLPAPPGRNR